MHHAIEWFVVHDRMTARIEPSVIPPPPTLTVLELSLILISFKDLYVSNQWGKKLDTTSISYLVLSFAWNIDDMERRRIQQIF
jgi:hypothetical protein